MHTPSMLRQQLVPLIQTGQLDAVAAILQQCKQASRYHRLGFAAVFTPSVLRDGSQLPLFCAVQAGQTAIVAYLLEQGCPLEQRDVDGRTPLYKAFAAKQLPMAQDLIDRGADIHAATSFGARVFDMALTCGDLAWLDWFLARGAQLDHTTQSGMTTLHYACMSNSVALVDRVKSLTPFRFDQANENGLRCLDACEHLEVFLHVLAQQPDMPLNVTFKDGGQSLVMHAADGSRDIVLYLLDHGVDAKLLGQDKSTLMHYAVASGDLILVAELIRRKVNVEARNKHNYRPLHWAVSKGNLAMVKLLVESGKAKVNIKSNTNFIIRETFTPLYMAVRDRHAEIARYLVEHGATLDELNDTSHSTAVVAAARNGDVPLLRYLLEHGASPNGVSTPSRDPTYSDYYYFPLAGAANAETVNLLVEFGADVNAASQRTGYCNSALRELVRSVDSDDEKTEPGRQRIGAVAALLAHGAKLEDNGYGSILGDAKCKAVAELLVQAAEQRGAAAPQSDVLRVELGRALWDMSSNIDEPEQMEAFWSLLQKATAEDLNFVHEDDYYNQETTLHHLLYQYRCYEENDKNLSVSALLDCVVLMLKLGANPNAVETLWGETPLHKAAATASTRYTQPEEIAQFSQLLEALLDAGADPHAANEAGAKPIDLLRRAEHVQLLKQRGAAHGSHPANLFEAVEESDTGDLHALMPLMDNLDGRDGDGDDLLDHWMITHNDANTVEQSIACLQILLEYFDIASTNDYGLNMLMLACYRGPVWKAEYLFEHYRFDLNQQDNDGEVALGLLLRAEPRADKAIEARRVALAKRFIARGARVDIVDSNGDTPLDHCRTVKLRQELQRVAKSVSA